MRDVTFIMPRALVRLDPANQKKRCVGAYGLQKMLVKFDVLTGRVINMSKSVQFFPGRLSPRMINIWIKWCAISLTLD